MAFDNRAAALIQRRDYRDPKTGGTWSGHGRMATWLAERVKAGEKVDKFLA
jgi:DNA-binding protein H-NS